MVLDNWLDILIWNPGIVADVSKCRGWSSGVLGFVAAQELWVWLLDEAG